MSDSGKVSILVVSGDAELRSRAVQALGETFTVRLAADLTSALDEIVLGPPVVALIDAELPCESLTCLLDGLGDPDRAVLWVSEPQPELLRLGALLQIPHGADDAVLRAAVQRLADLQSLRAELSRQKGEVGPIERLLESVREVCHKINSPLTAIMAEAELLLMDAEDLNEEQRKGLQTIEQMARRIRDLLVRLRELGEP